jgi:circadian clock protein KaiC
MHKRVRELKPAAVIVDPVSNFATAAEERDVHAMLIRLTDFLKTQNITALFTNLTSGDMARESTDMGISSVMDTWLLLRDIEIGGERNRGLYVLKGRGMQHSNQIREFLITPQGLELIDVYTGAGTVLTGSARQAQEAKERGEQVAREQAIERNRIELESKRAALEAQITAMRAQFEADQERSLREMSMAQSREEALVRDREAMAQIRKADAAAATAAAAARGSKNPGNGQRPRRGK